MPAFRYEQLPESPYLADILALMQRGSASQANAIRQGGEAAARATMAGGQAAAQIGQSIGQAAGQVAQIPQQIQQQKRLQTDEALAATRLTEAKQAQTDRASLDTAFSDQPDRESILKALPGHLQPAVRKQFADADEAALKIKASKDAVKATEAEYFGGLGYAIQQHGYDPTAAALAIQHAKATYADDPGMLQQIDQIAQHVQQQPEALHTIADALVAGSPKWAQQAETARKNLATEAQAKTNAATVAADKATDNARQDRAQVATERYQDRMASASEKRANATAGDVTNLTPAGLDAAALNYAKTGNLPPLGMGDKVTRKQIINRAAEMMPGLDIASAKADYDANKTTLSKLQQQRASVGAFEKTAEKNIDLFLEAAGKVVDTGSPIANKIARTVSGSMLGSPNQAAYDAARQVAINEIAKVTSNPTLAGQLSDSARKEVEAFNPANATLKQTVAVIRTLKKDMQNRTSGIDEQIAGIQDRIKKAQTPEPAPASGSVSVTAPNGKSYTFPSQAEADAFKVKAGMK